MKARPNELIELVDEHRVLFLFGDDYGAMQLLIAKLKKRFDVDEKIGFMDFTFVEIENDPKLLIAQACSGAFWGGKLLQISEVKETIKNAEIKDFLRSYAGESLIVFVGYGLTARCTIRSFFESLKNSLAVGFYLKSNRRNLLCYLYDKFDLKFSNEAQRLFEERVDSYDSLMLVSELKKLKLCLEDASEISSELVDEVVSVLVREDFNLLVMDLIDCDVRGFFTHFDEICLKGFNAVLIIRIILSFLCNLLLVKVSMQNGDSFSVCIGKFKIKMHFSLYDRFRMQVHRCDMRVMQSFMNALYALESVCMRMDIGNNCLKLIILLYFLQKKS